MKCTKAKKHISRYLDGELGGDEKDDLFEHLKVCQDCQHEYETLYSILNSIEVPEEIPAPPYLFSNIRQKIYVQESQPVIIRRLKPVLVPALFLIVFFVSSLISSLLVRRIVPQYSKEESAALKLTLNLTVFDDAPATSFPDIYNSMMSGETK